MGVFKGPLRAEDLARAGVPFDDPQEECPHCGRQLDRAYYVSGGKVVLSLPEPCGCDGEARAREAEEAERRSSEEKRRDDERERRYKRAGIPKRFLGAQTERREAIEFLATFEERHGQGLYIHGAVGRGKTYEASAIAKEFVDAGYSVVFTTAAGMLESIKETFDGSGSTADAVARYTKCDVLVMDDLGKEATREWSVNTIFMVLNARYEAMLPTVITSNFAPDEIAEKIGRRGEREAADAIASRIAETCRPLCLAGPDRRTGKM